MTTVYSKRLKKQSFNATSPVCKKTTGCVLVLYSTSLMSRAACRCEVADDGEVLPGNLPSLHRSWLSRQNLQKMIMIYMESSAKRMALDLFARHA